MAKATKILEDHVQTMNFNYCWQLALVVVRSRMEPLVKHVEKFGAVYKNSKHKKRVDLITQRSREKQTKK